MVNPQIRHLKNKSVALLKQEQSAQDLQELKDFVELKKQLTTLCINFDYKLLRYTRNNEKRSQAFNNLVQFLKELNNDQFKNIDLSNTFNIY